MKKVHFSKAIDTYGKAGVPLNMWLEQTVCGLKNPDLSISCYTWKDVTCKNCLRAK